MRRTLLPLVVGILLFLPCAKAFAFGVGAFGEYAYGAESISYAPFSDAHVEVHGDTLLLTREHQVVDSDAQHLSVGVLLDTASDAQSLLNYQLALGYRGTWLQWRDDNDDVLFSNGITMDNALGLAVIRGDAMRAWIGPAVSLSADFYRHENVKIASEDQPTKAEDAIWNQWDLSIGIGPELGVNVFWQDVFSIVVTLGYQYTFVYSSIQAEQKNAHGDYDVLFEDSPWGGEHFIFGRLGILLNRWDFGTL